MNRIKLELKVNFIYSKSNLFDEQVLLPRNYNTQDINVREVGSCYNDGIDSNLTQ